MIGPLAIGDVALGRYRVTDLLGAGAQAVIYEAEDLRGGAKVAIRALLMRANEVGYDQALARFNRAAGLKVNHPNVVRALGSGTLNDGTPIAVQGFVRGMDLGAVLARRSEQPLGERAARHLAVGLARGLDALHTAGVIHRDLKPANIIIADATGHPVICDLGLAKLANAAGTVTPEGTKMLGSPPWLAPEQWRDATGVDGRSDLYSFGIVLFEVCTGRHPYMTISDVDQCRHAALNGQFTHPCVVRPGTPKDLAELCMQLLAKRPEDRPQSAAQVRRLLGDGAASPPQPMSLERVARCLACGARLGLDRPCGRCTGCGRLFPCRSARLRIVATGERFYPPCGEYTIGRAQLAPRDQTVSRHQCCVRCNWLSGRLSIADAGGGTTKINGHVPTDYAGLHGGDRVQFGRHVVARYRSVF